MATVRRFKCDAPALPCDAHWNPVLWPKSSLITERKPVALSRWIASREERELVPKLLTKVKGVFLIETGRMKKGKITTSLLDCLICEGTHLIL
jgi:hypothetical protein